MIKEFDIFLETEFNLLGNSKVVEAMRYSLFAGGKRLRPLMLLSLLKDYGIEVTEGYYAAAALECIHTYSLIHDDLPALDNDDMRRFKPTNHIVYGEDIAILAGDGLLTLAFYFLAKGNYRNEVVQVLSKHAGVEGMILGQEYDILDNIHSLKDLEQCYSLKTGALFAAATQMATLIANRDESLDIAQELGYKIGIAFQHQDDLLESLSSSDKIGKSSSSDLERSKATITRFMEVDSAVTYVETIFKSIEDIISNLQFANTTFIDLLTTISKRSI